LTDEQERRARDLLRLVLGHAFQIIAPPERLAAFGVEHVEARGRADKERPRFGHAIPLDLLRRLVRPQHRLRAHRGDDEGREERCDDKREKQGWG
jgi:hypothetical protein